MPAKREIVQYKDFLITINRKLTTRRTTLRIRNGKITVSTNMLEPTGRILSFVREKEDFIRRGLYRQQYGLKNAVIDFNQGGSGYFLGEPCEVIILNAGKGSCYFQNGQMVISGPSETAHKNAFKRFAQDVLDELIDDFRRQLAYPIGDYTLKYRFYTSRWGCCIKNATQGRREIVINLWCIAMPVEAIKYIFYHELAHLRISNHQKEFYTHLSQLDPGYRKGLKLSKQFMLK